MSYYKAIVTRPVAEDILQLFEDCVADHTMKVPNSMLDSNFPDCFDDDVRVNLLNEIEDILGSLIFDCNANMKVIKGVTT